MGNFFHKKALHWGINYFGKIFEGCFTWGLMIRPCKGRSYECLRGFKGRVKLVFPLIDPDLGYWYIIWKVKITNRGLNLGLNLKNTFCTLWLRSWGFHVKSLFFFKKSLVVTNSVMPSLLGSFRFTYLPARLMKKWVKVPYSETEGSWLKPTLLVTLESNKYQTQWLRWWIAMLSGLPGRSSSRGKLYFVLL